MVLAGHTSRVRFGFLGVLLILVSAAFGQSQPDTNGSELVTPPQVFIVVKKHSMGSDLVRVTAMQPDYPPEVLKLQCSLIGKFADGNARGIEVSSRGVGGASGSLVTATFACDNLIDYTNNRLNLDAIVKGFLGSANPMISSFVVQFDGEQVNANTIQQFQDKNVILEGREYKNPDGIEYRIEVLTQDTREISIPGSLSELPKTATKPVVKQGLNPIVFPILIGGIIVAGALVYFALVRPGHRTRKN
jgi:hypothetical protein